MTLGFTCAGRRLSTASRTLGLNFAAQPAAFAVVVRRICSVNVISPWNRFDDYSARRVADFVRKKRRFGSSGNVCGLCVRGGRANGNRDRLGRFFRGEHVATPVEDGAGLHDQARRVDLAGDDSFGLNFHFAGSFYGAVEVPADDDVVAFDLPFHFGVLTEDQSFVRNQRPLHCGINTKGAGTFQPAFELHALVEETSPLPRIMSFAVKPTHASSPRYVNSVTLFSHELVVEAGQITIIVVFKH